MQVRVGYEIVYDCVQPTPMVLMLHVHHSRIADIVVPDHLVTEPVLPVHGYHDSFGNWCSRLVAPAGRTRIASTAIVNDAGLADPIVASARQQAVQHLPDDTLAFLLGSRYRETDRLPQTAWALSARVRPGEAGCRQSASSCTTISCSTTWRPVRPRRRGTCSTKSGGVCRDYAHLAVAFTRAMNIPARYCTGYLSDIGVPPPHSPMDFAGRFEAYLDGAWYTFDPHNNKPLYGTVLIARGRDAVDVPISNAFGPNTLVSFKVMTDEEVATKAS
jgi:transglutaminase-like putative cysteine protease